MNVSCCFAIKIKIAARNTGIQGSPTVGIEGEHKTRLHTRFTQDSKILIDTRSTRPKSPTKSELEDHTSHSSIYKQ